MIIDSTDIVARENAATMSFNRHFKLAIKKERIGLAHVVVKIWSMASPPTTSSNFSNSPCVIE